MAEPSAADPAADPTAGGLIAGSLAIIPIAGIPELRPGDDLAGLICQAAPWLRDGDILVVTSKAVSKVEGRLVATPIDIAGRERAREQAIAAETTRVVAERGATRIVQTRHGWVMAAAGVDASNVALGELALLPLDSDASARDLRQAIGDRAGVWVAVIISDTNGRTWRRGLTDVAIGVAGMAAIADLRGQPDTSGMPLEITEIAVADELAAAGDLVKGKLSGTPAAVVRGLHPPVDDGRGAAALRRPAAEDMFALGTRDVVRTRRAATGFAARAVPAAVLQAAIEAALSATGTGDGFGPGGGLQLLADPVRTQADPEIAGAQATPAGRLLGQAAAVIVPALPDQADIETVTQLGMAIAALLIQLHAEGLAASWLSPTDVADAGLDAAFREGILRQLRRGAQPHGLVVVGHQEDQIDR